MNTEPDRIAPIPVEIRASNNTLLFLDGHTGSTIRNNLFVWQMGVDNLYAGIPVNHSD